RKPSTVSRSNPRPKRPPFSGATEPKPRCAGLVERIRRPLRSHCRAARDPYISLDSRALWQYRSREGRLARRRADSMGRLMALRDVKLDDKFDLGHSRVFVTGFQALVRLCLMEKELDRSNGLNTAAYITGYRCSPLGGLDGQFLRAAPHLQKNDILFQGGINEDLAATAIWGSQQAEL